MLVCCVKHVAVGGDVLYEQVGPCTHATCAHLPTTSTQGDPADCLYLIARGIVEVYGPDGAPLVELGPGAHVGEEALLRAGPSCRSHTAVALVDCELQVLHKRQYQELVGYFPELASLMGIVAQVPGDNMHSKLHTTLRMRVDRHGHVCTARKGRQVPPMSLLWSRCWGSSKTSCRAGVGTLGPAVHSPWHRSSPGRTAARTACST